MDDAALTRGAAGISALASTVDGGARSAEVEDGELVRRVRRGDDRAFEQLYHRYHRRITAYIHGMVNDHARAEDVAQDVFVSALRRMRDTNRPIAFKPWIYEIAKNACIDQFRRSRRAEEVSYDADEGMGAADYGRLVSSDAVPETELESKQSLDHLRGAFGGLSETHHEILVMRELEGLSYREIGERLGMSRPSVESTLFRARRRLTEEYEELVSGARCQRIQSIIAGAAGATPGARDQRRLARHVSHCQPCRRQARMAGLDIPVTPDRPVRQRIAAMLPLPLFLRKRWSGDNVEATNAGSGQLSGVAQWTAQFGSTVDPGWIKAAATAATVAVAGAGAGLGGATPSASSSVDAFNRLVPSLGAGESRTAKRFAPGAGPVVSAALRTGSGSALAVTVAAAGSSSSSAAAGSSDRATVPSGTSTGSAGNATQTPSDAVAQAGTGLSQTASGVESASGSTGAGSVATAPLAGGANTDDVSASGAPSAPFAPGIPDGPGVPDASVSPPASDAPAAPPVNAAPAIGAPAAPAGDLVGE